MIEQHYRYANNFSMKDDVLEAVAAKGGVIGIEAAPHTTLTTAHRSHGLESFMEHFEYVKGLVGIDHVGFGPDSLYGVSKCFVESLSTCTKTSSLPRSTAVFSTSVGSGR